MQHHLSFRCTRQKIGKVFHSAFTKTDFRRRSSWLSFLAIIAIIITGARLSNGTLEATHLKSDGQAWQIVDGLENNSRTCGSSHASADVLPDWRRKLLCIWPDKPRIFTKQWTLERSARLAFAGGEIALILVSVFSIAGIIYLFLRQFHWLFCISSFVLVILMSPALYRSISDRFAIHNDLAHAILKVAEQRELSDISYTSTAFSFFYVEIGKWSVDGYMAYVGAYSCIILILLLCFREQAGEWEKPECLRARQRTLYLAWFLIITLMSVGVVAGHSHLQYPVSFVQDDVYRTNLSQIFKSVIFLYGGYLSLLLLLIPLPCLLLINQDISKAAQVDNKLTEGDIRKWREEHDLRVGVPEFVVPVFAVLGPILSPQVVEILASAQKVL